MKKFLVLTVLFLSVQVLAQVVAPVAPIVPPVPVVAPAVVAAPSFLAMVKADWAGIALALYAILDVIIYFNPKLSSNGLLQQVLSLLKKQSPPVA